MFYSDVVWVFIVSLTISTVFATALRRPAWGREYLLYLFLLTLSTLAGGLYVAPIGPVIGGVVWLTYLLVGVFVALLLLTLIPPPGTPERIDKVIRHGSRAGNAFVVDIFFWILVSALLLVIFFGYRH